MQEEFGAKASGEAGIKGWAEASLAHSERDVHQIIGKQALRIDIPLKDVAVAGQLLPWIPPSSWLKYLVDNNLWFHLAGLQSPDMAQTRVIWKGFWERFCGLYPDFELPPDFKPEQTAAVYLHGDEGRTLKKSALMVTAFQSCLGFGCAVNGRTRKSCLPGHAADATWQVNYRGHSFTTRFVTNILTKKLTEQGYDEASEELAKDLSRCLLEGYTHHGVTYKMCVIGCKGDWPFLIRAGHLVRHFSRSIKKVGNEARAAGVCHLCKAGMQGIPAEECGFTDSKWLRSGPGPEPWLRRPPLLRHLPCRASHPGSFYEPDLWHAMHLGVGKAFASSTIIVSITSLPMFTQLTMERRWQACTEHYLNFCKASGRQGFVTKITPSLVSYNDSTGAVGGWHKGNVTTNMILWLQALLEEHDSPDLDRRLVLAKQAAQAMNEMMRFLYDSGAFLSRTEAAYISSRGLFFLRAYSQMALQSFNEGRPQLYPLVPKLHALDHMMVRAHVQGQSVGYTCNLLSTACQQDEDLIGRVSRVSRRVSIRSVIHRTFQRYLAGTFAVWREAGLVILPGK